MHTKFSDSRYNHSRSRNQFSRYVIGDFTFGLYQQKARHKLFLQRNISRVLEHHAERRKEKRPWASSTPLVAKNTTDVEKVSEGTISGASGAGRVVKSAAVDGTETSGDPTATSNSSQLTTRNMSSRPDPCERNGTQQESTRQRSIRGLVNKTYHHPNAELMLDLSNIRRKLNFKTNCLSGDQRPSKRQKRDAVRCLCHLTIWDNRDGCNVMPLTTKSSYCDVTVGDNGVHGYFVDLELEEPFVVKATELKVPIQQESKSVRGIINKYFLEIKIIPFAVDSCWPPIPIMSKSDADKFTSEIGKVEIEELQGAIVARYTHLPQAPDPDVPLSVFFLHEGRTYKTNYGLQVTSTWQKSDLVSKPTEPGSKDLDIDSFLSQNLNAVYLPERPKRDQKPAPKAASQSPHQPETSYTFSSTISRQAGTGEEFRNAIVEGYRCPLCAPWKSRSLQNLLFHLTTTHPKYNFSVARLRRDPITNEPTEIQIKVDTLVNLRREENDFQFHWQAPAKPFDLSAYVEGDRSWTGEKAVKKPPLSGITTSNNSWSTISGSRYPLASEVPDFRKPNRRKARAICLQSKYDTPEDVWTSISDRPVSPSEEPRSDTDDEVDNSLHIERHMELLEIMAQKQGWSNHKRELYKRWNRHRTEEHLEHPRYLSNSLIRFVRKHRRWLKDGSDELCQVFFDFLSELKEKKVIDDNVVADVNELIFQGPPSDALVEERETSEAVLSRAPEVAQGSQGTKTANVQSRTRVQAQRTQKRHGESDKENERAQTQMTSEYKCGDCLREIELAHKNTICCADPECRTPGKRYHKRCALYQRLLFGKKRRNIPTHGDFGRPLPELSPTENEKLENWMCKHCVAKWWVLLLDRTPKRIQPVKKKPIKIRKKVRRRKVDDESLLKWATHGAHEERMKKEEMIKNTMAANEGANGKGKEFDSEQDGAPHEDRWREPDENSEPEKDGEPDADSEGGGDGKG
ncbi:uncharacterized protein Z519_06504 [Cladophialophora bantiana CBS 173.52]|uniref:Polycomb protein VEFS-Box domain-containing protein n=1 Tax=Cladophialophora bantiana (strain ATCC 10958 / CBS 173.52 / CDC B-1940 / NIH 8579) TaxID=1442370 RepID=A0A0D2G1P1_CLAB1|nr:uncharacterized protein Z519_06504 [Cladophialophora bantiana CBS 173.52]KIW92657.1 hypothetical protein Z519_06504 [Cladophialophora bantiana CBS 173.52]